MMDEELSNVLGNDELDSNAKAEVIKKLIGGSYVPLKKYTDDVATVKKENKELKDVVKNQNIEIEGYKNSQLTDDQKKQKELEDIANTKRELAIERSQIQAEKILSKVITEDKELESLVKGISSENIEATKVLATNLVDTITKQKEATEAKIREELIKDTPKPTGGEADKTMTKDKFSKLSYNEQVKYKIENPEGYKQLFN